jgi:hypothetical protein
VPWTEALAAARFLWALPRHLRRPLTVDVATAVVQERLARREAEFLALVRDAVYANPRSPYRRLLAAAGCEPGDLARLVRLGGVEGALEVLFRHGVYLTVDEFKGRRPVRRGSATVTLDPADLRNPLSAGHLPTQSGGSGGTPSVLVYALASIRDQTVNALLALAAHGGEAWVKGVWGVSTGSAPVVLRFGSFGRPVARWFLHVRPDAPGVHPRYRWVPGALRLAARAAGVAFPRPELAPLDDPLAIARWIADTRRAGRTPHLYAFASPVNAPGIRSLRADPSRSNSHADSPATSRESSASRRQNAAWSEARKGSPGSCSPIAGAPGTRRVGRGRGTSRR